MMLSLLPFQIVDVYVLLKGIIFEIIFVFVFFGRERKKEKENNIVFPFWSYFLICQREFSTSRLG